MKIRIRISNLQEVKRFHRRVNLFGQVFMRNLRTAQRQAGRDMVRFMRAVMEDEPWIPNADAYRDWKRHHGYATVPLFRTSLLANSISHQAGSFSPQKISGQIGWYSGAQYGGQLQEKIYSGRVPRRRRTFRTPQSMSFSTRDTQMLADVAYWNETGSSSRPERPFVKTTYEKYSELVVNYFEKALVKSLPISGLMEGPF